MIILNWYTSNLGFINTELCSCRDSVLSLIEILVWKCTPLSIQLHFKKPVVIYQLTNGENAKESSSWGLWTVFFLCLLLYFTEECLPCFEGCLDCNGPQMILNLTAGCTICERVILDKDENQVRIRCSSNLTYCTIYYSTCLL